MFNDQYKSKLTDVFSYVVDIPIKERSHHIPKYRLIFAGNYPDGVLLMADEMNKAWRDLLVKEAGGQVYLFSHDEMLAAQIGRAEDLIWAELSDDCELGRLLCRLMVKYGISYSTSQYKAAIRGYEGERFGVTREPYLTKTGKKASSMDQNRYRITISRLPFDQILL